MIECIKQSRGLLQNSNYIKVADEVWIATALLHRENPQAADFGIGEIVARVVEEHISGELRPGVQAHVSVHAVANKPPNPGRYRLLMETRRGRRRLFRPGDPAHPNRAGGKTTPNPQDLPPKYRDLLRWYEEEYSSAAANSPASSKAARGKSTRALLRFIGVIPADDVARMERAIEEQSERIDAFEH